MAHHKYILWLPALLGLLAGCASAPVGRMGIDSSLPEEVWIAPKIAESSQRELTVPVILSLDPGLKPNGYRLTIRDGPGREVRVIETKAALPKRGLFGWSRQSLPAPGTMVWDGKNEAGAYVADGAYTYELEVWDGLGNTGKSRTRTVHVDNTYPNVELAVSSPYFSPRTEGGPDTLTIYHANPTPASVWNGGIANAAGVRVRSFSWEGSPADVVWDGTDDQGLLLPDGAYYYQISAVNRAGTPRTIRLADPLLIDTRPKEVALALQYRAFSPAGNSPRKTLTLRPLLKTPDRTASWVMVIYDSRNHAVRTYRGVAAPPAIVFEGKDDGGRLLPEGSYRAVLDVSYAAGEAHKAMSPTFRILNTGPTAALRVTNLVFAPGMGKKPSLIVHLEAEEGTRWSATVFNSNWQPVLNVAWERLPSVWKWDGRDAAGIKLADGFYRFILTGSDEAENTRSYEVSPIRIDTRAGRASLQASDTLLSPNGDEIKDTVAFSLGAENQASIAVWEVRIGDARGAERRRILGMGPWEVNTAVWDGLDDGGGKLPDGSYAAALAVEYENGLTAVSEPAKVYLDSTPPELAVSLSPALFSPDGDGENDTLNITVGYQDRSPAESYSFRILDPTRQLYYETRGAGVPSGPLAWDGRFMSGELVQSASDYPYRLSVRDAAGNTAVAAGNIPIDILVIREGDKLRIDVPYIHFEPWSAELISREQDAILYAQTQKAFALLIPKLQKFPDYSIRIEGHAVRIFWWDEYRLGRAEERAVLEPLSLARAEKVRDELVARGVAAERLLLEGLGGTEPLVPHSDLAQRWRNRRVEFILLKE